jgi:hypothetical protein
MIGRQSFRAPGWSGSAWRDFSEFLPCGFEVTVRGGVRDSHCPRNLGQLSVVCSVQLKRLSLKISEGAYGRGPPSLGTGPLLGPAKECGCETGQLGAHVLDAKFGFAAAPAVPRLTLFAQRSHPFPQLIRD